MSEESPDEPTPRIRPSRRCSNSSSTRAGSTSRAISAPASSAASSAAWTRVGCESFGDYLDYLEVNPGEYELLFEMLLINVTEFFRDPAVVGGLREEVLPEVLAGKAPDEPVRDLERGRRQRPGGLFVRDRARRVARASTRTGSA